MVQVSQCFCFLMVVTLLIGEVVSGHMKPFLEPPTPIRNASSMWLHSPPINNDDRTSSRKRKHEEVNLDEVTLCWPNTLLGECKEVTVSKESYTTLHYHHAGDLTECLCALEGFGTVESKIKGPLFIDGKTFDAFPRYVVTTYTIPDLDISFQGSTISEDSGDANVVCWPNPLLGECKEAEISQSEINEILAGEYGDDFDLDVCSCASSGFAIAKEDSNDKRGNSEERYTTGVKAYSPSPRATLCFFEGQQTPEHGMLEVHNGVNIQKGELCKQVTIDPALLYIAKGKTLMKKNFNEAGIFECPGGCTELGYSGILQGGSRQQKYLRPVLITGNEAGMRQNFDLVQHRNRKTSPGEWVYTYHTTEYTPRVTLCFFDGQTPDHGILEVDNGVKIQKGELCKQVTIDRNLLKKNFNEAGIFECPGGCTELGYSLLLQGASSQQSNLKPTLLTGNAAGKRKTFHLVSFHDRKTSPGEWVDTYHTTEYTPLVTLCAFDGEEQIGQPQWWKPKDGGMVRKRQLCRQVTISREMYSSRASLGARGRKEKFNKYGVYECGEGGCDQLGFNVHLGSKQQATMTVKLDNPEEGVHTGKYSSRLYLTPPRSKELTRVDTYVSFMQQPKKG